jgi:CBS domain-containing protein
VNVAYFLTPKAHVAWIPVRSTMRQALERMEAHHYAAVPLLDDEGRYVGTLTEGDLLWFWKHRSEMTFHDTEQVRLEEVPRNSRPVFPVSIDAEMEQLFSLAASQNFVPVVDGREVFIGIVRRASILEYLVARLHGKDPRASQRGEGEAPPDA